MDGKNLGWAAGMVAVGVVAGGILASTLSASAQTPTPSPSSGTTQSTPRAGETPLTGTNAEKAKAAALKALPGATIERVETDADGGVYEAHVVKADGTRVTVVMDKDFNVTEIKECPGGGRGPKPDDTSTTSSSA